MSNSNPQISDSDDDRQHSSEPESDAEAESGAAAAGLAFAEKYPEIQPEDDATPEQAVEGIIQTFRERARREQDLELEGYVRELLKETQKRIGQGADRMAGDLLGEVRSIIEKDSDLQTVLDNPVSLADYLDIEAEKATRIRAQYRQQARARERGVTPMPRDEYHTVAAVARALRIHGSERDQSRYAPVVIENLDHLGSLGQQESPTPVGRRRLKAGSKADLDSKKVVIPHDSCDHVLAVALPRSGKDSTLTSFGMNLWREHGYSYFSIFDDGRMETPMLPVPNDEPVIQQNLERLGQEPRGFDGQVMVPRMEDSVPDQLPANFRLFTIGLDQLTPEMILNFAGVSKREGDIVHRIQQALEETLANGGDVSELVFKLNLYARETPAEVSWTEEIGERSNGNVVTKTAEYTMPAADVLRDAANQLARLAGAGLITSPEAASNLDIADLIRDQETATILCTSFLDRGQEPLKYYIINLWLELIWEAREENPRLPRCCMEIRELKDLAPSKHGFGGGQTKAIRALKQTLFKIMTRGGSRGMMLLASTQKLNDIEKSIRQNFATKILLRLGEEEIETLDRSHNFTDEQKAQLKGFNIGWGMVVAGGDKFYPIEFRGAPCALSLKDEHWLDRYGKAFGARVRTPQQDSWPSDSDTDWWVHVPDQTVHDPADDQPVIGEKYSQWYLVAEDFPNATSPENVGGNEALVRAALRNRRPYPLETDLMLRPTDFGAHQDGVTFNPEDLPTKEQVIEDHDIPRQVHDWLDKDQDVRERLVTALEILDEYGPVRTQNDWAEPHPDWNRNTLAGHFGEGGNLEPCYTKTDDNYYDLSVVGEAVVELDWKRINIALYEAE